MTGETWSCAGPPALPPGCVPEANALRQGYACRIGACTKPGSSAKERLKGAVVTGGTFECAGPPALPPDCVLEATASRLGYALECAGPPAFRRAVSMRKVPRGPVSPRLA